MNPKYSTTQETSLSVIRSEMFHIIQELPCWAELLEFTARCIHLKS